MAPKLCIDQTIENATTRRLTRQNPTHAQSFFSSVTTNDMSWKFCMSIQYDPSPVSILHRLQQIAQLMFNSWPGCLVLEQGTYSQKTLSTQAYKCFQENLHCCLITLWRSSTPSSTHTPCCTIHQKLRHLFRFSIFHIFNHLHFSCLLLALCCHSTLIN